MKKIYFTLCFALLACLALGQTSKTVNVTTAGQLYTLLNDLEAKTITDLTVTGTIDARDVKFMRDSMTVLANADLWGVNIAAYTGTGGTYSSVSTIYPANEMPRKSFFYKTGLKTIVLPNTITMIGIDAFNYCSALTGTLTIPESVTIIEDMAFSSCSGITGLSLSKSLNKIGVSAFANCSGLTGTLTIPGTVETIGNAAFSNCSKLTGSLTIPNSVTSIGALAFGYCSGFSGDLSLSNTLTTIGATAFRSCSGFTGNLIIPNTVTTIGENAFANCSGFTGNITISNSLTAITNNVFSNCFGLSGSLTIPNSVTTIGNAAFLYCNNLTGSLTIPNSVTSIGTSAFSNCSGLEELYLSKNLTQIPLEAFGGCFGLKKIRSANPTPPTITNSTFISVDYINCQLFVPIDSKDSYQIAQYWSEFQNVSEEDFSAGIRIIETNGCIIYGSNGQIVVLCNETNTKVEILSPSGVPIQTIYTQDRNTAITLPKGVYIVRIGNFSRKIIL